jgi:hypothetical protein
MSPLGQFVQHSHLGEQVRTVEHCLAQYPDAVRVVAIERAHLADLSG